MRRRGGCALRAASVLLCVALGAVLAGCGSGTTANNGGTVLPVSIETLSLADGTVGGAYNVSILAENGTAPYQFVLKSGSLPAGLTLASSGAISGTPTAPTTASFVVQVTDAKGGTASATLTLTITVASQLTITTTSLSGGTVGTAYNATIGATGGATPYSFGVAGGSLPAGLTLSTTGALAGTPTAAGTSSFSVKVTDNNGQTATASFTVAIAASASQLAILTASLPSGTVGAVYSATIAATNGTMPYHFAVTTGALPPGLSLATGGALTGTPTTAGTSTLTVTVTDANGQSASMPYAITVAAASSGLAITTAALASGQVNVPYEATVTAGGGTAPYSFAISSGSLPAGLTLGSDGLIEGTPTATGTASVTITVTDETNHTASATLSITISAATTLAITTASLPNGTYAVPYSATISASGGTPPYRFAVSGGQLPAGLTLTSGGTLSGSPIVGSASSTFSITVTDAAYSHASATYTVSIAYTGPPALTIVNTTLPTALVNTSYTASMITNGGTSPYTYALVGGALPSGMTLSTAGTISGTATTTGTSTFSVKATDSSNPAETVTASVQLTVATVSATVVVNTAATLRTIPTNFYGLHTSVYDTSLNDTANLPGLLAQTGVTVLRYPGGGYSDNYHWAQYSITPFYTSTAPACNAMPDGVMQPDGDFGTFVRLLKASNTQGMITVDYGNSVANASGSKTTGTDGRNTCSEPNTYGQPEEAAAWVAYANGSASSTQVIGVDATGFDWKTVGYWAGLRAATPLANDDGYNFLRLGLSAPVGIRYWEIGNELYYNGWATNHNSETDNHAPYIYPNGYTPGAFNSRNALDALSPRSYGTNAVQWIQAMKAVDPTIQIGVDFSSPIATDPIPANWNPDLAQAVCAGANIDFAIMHYYPGTYLNVQPNELLRLPQADIPFVYSNIQNALQAFCPANASSVQTYLTETSPNGTLAANFPQPVIGLFAANELLTAAQTGIGTMEWLELHDGTYLSESETPGPAYYGFEMAHLAASPGDTLVSTSSSSAYVLGWTSKKASGGEGMLLINADPSNAAVVSVQVSGAAVGSSATEYSYGLHTTQSGSALTPATIPIAGSTFQVNIPAYTGVVVLLH